MALTELLLSTATLVIVLGPLIGAITTLWEWYRESKGQAGKKSKITVTIEKGSSREVIKTDSIQNLERILRERTD
jgi:hypothetical protein